MDTKKSGYQPHEWEDMLYQRWLDSGFFNPDTCLEKGVAQSEKEPFSMVLPPPNATGTLHTGSACMLAIEDVFTRFARMQGRPALWLPGTDHAAIATQSKVERLLWEEEKKTRYDLGREALLQRIDEFVAKNQDTMLNQMKRMGASLDWSRLAFTLDEKRNKAVNLAFKKMYDEGIIFRGDRIVNWDPKGQTTISDDEVDHQERTTKFYYFQYGPFVIGTARPETKFGDKYVVMHPEDARYAEYTHGQTIELEWINGPITATIIKDEAIDPEFGSGVMTITPWHSGIDFEIAERHNLDKEQIIDLEGKLLPIAGEFAGMPIAEARKKIVSKLEDKGLLVKVEDDYVHQVATAERTGETIEPQIMRQWFVGVDKEFTRDGKTVTLKTLMREAVTSGQIKILPERFEKIYLHWVENLHDWCISRQIWYGHQIPVWYKGEEVFCGTEAPQDKDWTRDPDTLDTWFSSALWTFTTLGWGSNEELWAKQKQYHPTTILETGYDILPFWVSRMILMSTYHLGEVPFKTVYLHGLVRDEQGRKMSKSLDNILDPLDVIKEYGTDALRLALMSGTTPGNDLRVGDEKMTSSRNFVNKLWNISRYVKLQEDTGNTELRTPADHFIATRFESTRELVAKQLSEYNLSLAIDTLQRFTLDDFADEYIEIHKQEKNTPLLRTILQELITLWHPFIPFVTEAIWQDVFTPNELLLVRTWPQSRVLPEANHELSDQFALALELAKEIRLQRGTYKIDRKTSLSIELPQLNDTEPFHSIFTRENVQLATGEGIAIPVGTGVFSGNLFLGDAIDVEKERTRLQKEIAEAETYLTAMRAKLTNEGFLTKAGPLLKASTENLARVTEERIALLTKALDQLT
jgi:valyl-tRNA synthetase